MLTSERLREVLTYSPETGLFYWLERKLRPGFERVDKGWNTRNAGTEAGCVNSSDGYVQIYVDGRRYAAHRLAFLFQESGWPKECLDHINGERADNRWVNLRECSVAENNRNMKRQKANTSGLKGVFTATNGRSWFSQIGSGNELHYLGSFSTKEDAAAAYDTAALRLHGEFAKINEAA